MVDLKTNRKVENYRENAMLSRSVENKRIPMRKESKEEETIAKQNKTKNPNQKTKPEELHVSEVAVKVKTPSIFGLRGSFG